MTKKWTGNEKGMRFMDFSSGVFALFINDLQFGDSKIGDFKFYYDSISTEFVVKDNPDLRYPKSVILEDSSFLVFRESSNGSDREEFEPEFEVKPYDITEL